MATQTEDTYDIIIVGAGIAGTVIASRLHSCTPDLAILLIEAGPDPSTTAVGELRAIPVNVGLLRGSELDWDYTTVPQKNLNGRTGYTPGGKGIGGGSLINYGMWTRGDKKDYEDWARIAGDKRWSWEGFLPYFRKTEHHHDPNADPNLHGLDGPVQTTSVTASGRRYPLREPIREAWKELGVEEHADVNDGNSLGIAEAVEARTAGKRVDITKAYPLDGVKVLSDTLVKRVIISDDKIAKGVELDGGRVFFARREVIISAGSLRTPQILTLSGIGPVDELKKHGIKQVVNALGVGSNLWDHLGLFQLWNLKHPEIGAAFGSSKWTDPKFAEGNSIDWLTQQSLPKDELKKAMLIDDPEVDDKDSLLAGPRCHMGFLIYYMAAPAVMDGSAISIIALNHLPTSRGTITLASTDPKDHPVIDPKHLSTEKDRLCLRTGARKILDFVSTAAGKEIVNGELVALEKKPLTIGATDAEIDERIKEQSQVLYHPAGTAAMGTVVDSNLEVIGVKSLRVVDASVIPCPISSPPQACLYALAEQAVDIILGSVE